MLGSGDARPQWCRALANSFEAAGVHELPRAHRVGRAGPPRRWAVLHPAQAGGPGATDWYAHAARTDDRDETIGGPDDDVRSRWELQEVTDGQHRSGRDPLAAVEQAAITEEVQSSLRHELRNKFAAIRNASFYLKKRIGKTELWNSEPRLAEMSQVIEHDLTVASGLLDDSDVLARLWRRAIAPRDAAACVRRAVACMRGSPAVRVEVEA